MLGEGPDGHGSPISPTRRVSELERPQLSPVLGPFLYLERVGGWRIIEMCRFLPIGTLRPCAYRKSNPNVLVVQPAQERAAKNGPGQFDGGETGASFSKDKCVRTSL